MAKKNRGFRSYPCSIVSSEVKIERKIRLQIYELGASFIKALSFLSNKCLILYSQFYDFINTESLASNSIAQAMLLSSIAMTSGSTVRG